METSLTYNMQEFFDRSGADYGMIVSVHHKFGFHTLCMGGGAIRRSLIGMKLDSDFDYFFKNQERLDNWIALVEGYGFTRTSTTENQITYEGTHRYNGKDHIIKLQAVIIEFYDTIDDLFDSFDFTITQFAIQTKHWEWTNDGVDPDASTYFLHTTDLSLWDLARRKLAVHKITYPVASTRRMLKYMQQGFTACGGTITDLLKETIENPERVDLDVKYVD